MKKYKFKSHLGLSGYKNIDANKVAGFFEEKFPDGLLTRKSVLEAGRPKNSPIHNYFEWDDSIAGEKYRLDQAGSLIRMLVVVIDKDHEIPAYTTSLRIDKDQHKQYVEIEKAMHTKSIWDEVLKQGLRQAISWRERYKNISDLKNISKAISETEKKLIKKGIKL